MILMPMSDRDRAKAVVKAATQLYKDFLDEPWSDNDGLLPNLDDVSDTSSSSLVSEGDEEDPFLSETFVPEGAVDEDAPDKDEANENNGLP